MMSALGVLLLGYALHSVRWNALAWIGGRCPALAWRTLAAGLGSHRFDQCRYGFVFVSVSNFGATSRIQRSRTRRARSARFSCRTPMP
jgi:hypothetical protein